MRKPIPSDRKKMTLKEFSKLNGIPYKTLHFRLMKGYSVIEAITLSEADARSKGQTKHGMANSSEYSIWESMIQRCRSKTNCNYKFYGGRGITVCDRWNSFENFYADMGKRPKGLTLDRKNNNEGYSPENCRWITRKEQSRNTSRNVILNAFGKSQCISAWAEEFGISEFTIRQRIKNGYSHEFALMAKKYERRKNVG